MIFNYGYACCAFADNICGSQPKVPDGMPDTSKLLSPDTSKLLSPEFFY